MVASVHGSFVERTQALFLHGLQRWGRQRMLWLKQLRYLSSITLTNNNVCGAAADGVSLVLLEFSTARSLL